ncbi:cation channel family protein [Tritrichomonas foetus]|uniref:Cation channel family protein n=1 Tax=Tritrichomonas foetus TaxID=1144522 RepID=A0A1J4JWY4_9EUKA|nr:cation channel family protein [Tritrichomonas foetus]|eukprot:OHT02046.1 cation channel family protein [Tritrichomonas foetus]
MRKRGASFSSKLNKFTPEYNAALLASSTHQSEINSTTADPTKNNVRIFSHSNKYRRYWEYLILVVAISVLVEVSFYGIFINDMTFSYYSIFIIFDILYIIDLYIYTHTSYFSHGVQISSLRKIRNRIGWYRIIMHAFSCLPLSWIGILKKSRTIYLCLSIPRVFRIQRGIDASYTIKDTLIYSWSWSQLFQSILLEILCIHFFACIFYLSAYFEGIMQSWVKIHGWEYLTPPQLYVVSIYFVMTTILTIGFGDLTPKTSPERIIVIFIQLIGVMINAYIISMMVSSLMDPIGSRFERSFRSFFDFMNFKEINKELKTEILHFFQLKYQNIHGAEDLKEVFKFVPETVRDHLKLDMTRQCLSQISLMQIASEKLLVGFSNAMSHISFVPGEIIFEQGEIDSELYLFRSGTIRLYENGVEIRTESCDRGIGMGELELLIDTPRSMTVEAVTYVEGWVIERDDLITSMSHQRELRQELLQVCKLIFPDYYKDVRRLLYGVKERRKPNLLMRQHSKHFSDVEVNSSDSFEFVKPSIVTEPGSESTTKT